MPIILKGLLSPFGRYSSLFCYAFFIYFPILLHHALLRSPLSIKAMSKNIKFLVKCSKGFHIIEGMMLSDLFPQKQVQEISKWDDVFFFLA